jgi:type I restriction enzyme, S subunit
MRNEGWRTASLGDKEIALTASGGTPDRSDARNFGGDTPWVKSGELDDNIIYATEEKLTEQGLQNSSAKLFPRGTLLLAMYGATAGKTAVLGIEATTNQAVCAIFPQNGSFDSRFLQFQLIHNRPRLLNARSGGAQPNISQRVIATLDVVLPPIEEQRAIASALESLQKAKEARQRELVLERERKAALMELFFTHGTRGEPTKQTEIGDMPESWRVVRLGEIAPELRSGITPRGGEQVYLRVGIPLIRSQNVLMNRLKLRDVAYISSEMHESMAGSAVQPGDVLLNITGASIGRVTFVPDDLKVANVNQHVCRIRLAQHVEPPFVSYYLSTPLGQAQVMGSQFGTTRQGLNYGNVRTIKIPLPLLEEQCEISSALLVCDSKIEAVENENNLLEELFRALLEVLTSGQLSVAPLIGERQPQ